MLGRLHRSGEGLFLAAISALAACAGSEGEPSLGVASSPVDLHAWHVSDVGDFNADGMADVLWDHNTEGAMAVWLMDGTQLVLPGPVIPGPAGEHWCACYAADFNADGMNDVRWFNTATRETAVWLMAGTALLEAGPTIPAPAGAEWTRISTTDFNGDGMADLLWYNPLTRSILVWLMNGTAVLMPGPALPGPAGAGWTPVTTGDFNGDGLADVLWYNVTTRAGAVWLMKGTELLLAGPPFAAPPGAGWRIATAGDFDGDGQTDVVWYDTSTESIAIWRMSGTDVLLPGPSIPAPAGGGWAPVTTGDFNADRMADLIWENHDAHSFSVYLMASTAVLAAGPAIPGPLAP